MLRTSLEKILNKVGDLLFPITCVRCGKGEEPLCDACVEKTARSKDLPKKYLNAYFSYKDVYIKQLLQKLKYKYNYHLAKFFSKYLHELVVSALEEELSIREYYLVPIPSNTNNVRRRGFDQTFKLSKELSKISGMKMLDVLRRNSQNLNQAGLSRRERQENMRNIFSLNNTDCSGLNLILIDDIITTGTTAEEARNTCLDAKARSVQVIAVAH